MLAIALDDFTVNVLDIETRRIVRKFSGHRGQINDMVAPTLSLAPFLVLYLLSFSFFLSFWLNEVVLFGY